VLLKHSDKSEQRGGMVSDPIDFEQFLFASGEDPGDGAEPPQELARDRSDIAAWDTKGEQELQLLFVTKRRCGGGEPLTKPLSVARR
jgi:hypothetical protein